MNIDFFGIAKDFVKELRECEADSFIILNREEIDSVVEAMVVNKLVKTYTAGYQAAKEFYIDKPAGWGKE